ncbi:Inosine-5-monophosphate dehydrogenase [Staphylococcus aureus]|uniref:Inosine-5-monophosphate dehydrogenase n=1 Tax=Staphylococcus aureus TaxID=1280 RepID=A0A380EFT4_STAAU|nr:Inosine-5-monophosphate dehydrogenase [Staphylococcus aureus]
MLIIKKIANLVGILTNRDLRFIEDFSIKIVDVMTQENLITAPVNTTLEEAEKFSKT